MDHQLSAGPAHLGGASRDRQYPHSARGRALCVGPAGRPDEYFLAHDPAGSELVVEPNEIEDEDGKFFKQPDHDDSTTLLLAWHKAASEADAADVLDRLRESLGPVDGLVSLRRRQSTKPPSPPPGRTDD